MALTDRSSSSLSTSTPPALCDGAGALSVADVIPRRSIRPRASNLDRGTSCTPIAKVPSGRGRQRRQNGVAWLWSVLTPGYATYDNQSETIGEIGPTFVKLQQAHIWTHLATKFW